MKGVNKIAISIATGMAGRNFILSDMFAYLKSNNNIYYISNFSNSLNNEKNYNIKYNKVKRRISYYASTVYSYALWNKFKPDTKKKYIYEEKRSRFLKYYLFTSLSKIYNRFPNSILIGFLKHLIHTVNLRYIPNFDILVATSIDEINEINLIYTAKISNKKVVGIVHSWDNLAARQLLPEYPDILMVWNESMKHEAIKFHNYPEDKVKIIGVPQFQMYRDVSKNIKFKDFSKHFNVQLGDRIMLYCAAAERVFPDEERFVDELLDLLRINPGWKLIFRLHPEERRDLYLEKFKNTPGVLISYPDNGSRANYSENYGTIQAIREYIWLLKYSSVVINLASTVSLDATLFNTPVICPRYNPIIKSDEWNSAEKWYESSHFKPLILYGALYVANSKSEINDHLNSIINNPSERDVERALLRDKIMPEMDTRLKIYEALREFL